MKEEDLYSKQWLMVAEFFGLSNIVVALDTRLHINLQADHLITLMTPIPHIQVKYKGSPR
jgi:hypothetical protein